MKINNLNELRMLIRRVLSEDYEFNIEPELNIIGEINPNEISGTVPKGAQYAHLNPTEKFI